MRSPQWQGGEEGDQASGGRGGSQNYCSEMCVCEGHGTMVLWSPQWQEQQG